MYFSKFPYTLYSLDNRKTVQVVTNILLRVIIDKKLKENYSAFDEYDIRDGETPEILADRLYGNSQYHWLLLHFNDIIDPRFEWPLSYYNLDSYIKSKYPDPYDIHHYEDRDGNIVQMGNSYTPIPSALVFFPVTNYQYEEKLNEDKRRIKIIKPQFVLDFIKNFEDQIQS